MWNSIKIFYNDPKGILAERINKYSSILKEMIIYDVLPYNELSEANKVIIRKDLQVNDHQIEIILTDN